MSRKKSEKSNIPQIGIFLDKRSAQYNLLILETLLSQEVTAWQLAEILLEKLDLNQTKEIKEVKRYRTQKIYSVIQRKTGRLADLKGKGYIIEKDGKWKLKKKGLIALYTKKPNLVADEMQTNQNRILEEFKKEVSELPEETIKEPMGIQIDLAQFKKVLEKIDPTPFFILLLEESKALISEGIELDRISEEDFLDLVKFRSSLREKVGAVLQRSEE